MDIKDGNGLVFGYIQRKSWRSHYLIDIFGKLYKNGLTKSPHQPNSNGVIRMPYLCKRFQSPSFNLEYNRKNIDQNQYIYRSDITIEPRFNHILGNSNKNIQRPEEFNIRFSLNQWRTKC